MAKSHSRFTDEIFCTAAPSAPTIQVTKKEALVGEIFNTRSFLDFRDGLQAAEQFNSRELYEKYPPIFKDKNKQFILKLLDEGNKYLPLPDKSILITRWKPFNPIIETVYTVTNVQFRADTFDYEPNRDSSYIEWYLNFANSDLFAYYAGQLLAQDELQVLECVELASLREYLSLAVNSVGSHTIGNEAQTGKPVPTPILISNTERAVNLNIKEIYGNAFTKATEEQLRRAFKKLQPPQNVNLIAIEAPSYGTGIYTRDQIKFALTNCFTGFKAALILASKTYALNTRGQGFPQQRVRGVEPQRVRTIIHTGWWGCGAYGNNRQLMLVLQILAARWAQVDTIIFHIQDKQYQKDTEEATKIADRFLGSKDANAVIDELVRINFVWEKSNNT